MWNIEDINNKRNYIINRLSSNNITLEEKQRLQYTLAAYLGMIKSSNSLFLPRIPKFLNPLIKNKYATAKEKQYLGKWDTIPTIYKSELIFLVDLIINGEEELEFEDLNYAYANTKFSDMIKIVDNFYKSLGDSDIYNHAKNILSEESKLNITKGVNERKKIIYGETYQDFIFDCIYININKKNNIVDFLTLAHEVMHGIDFKFKKKLIFEYNGYINEIPAYTINLLFIEYLRKTNVIDEEVKKLEEMFFISFYLTRKNILDMLQIHFNEAYNRDFKFYDSRETIINTINPITSLNLIKFKSLIVAYGLYKQIIQNREKGLNNLKKYMKTGIKKIDSLDFSFIDLSDDNLMKIYNEMIDKTRKISSKNQKKYIKMYTR